MKTFLIILKRINKYLLTFVLLNTIWIYFYQMRWINRSASSEFWVVTGKIYFAVALSIVAGYTIYLITSEIPSIKKRIALSGILYFSIQRIKSNIREMLKIIDLNYEIDKLRNHLSKIDKVNFDKLLETKNHFNRLNNKIEISKETLIKEIHTKQKYLSENNLHQIEKLYIFSQNLKSSFIKLRIRYEIN